jgi:hypothetical protein
MVESSKESEDLEESAAEERELTKEEHIQLAKKAFDLVLRVRMNGPFKMEKEICHHFGVPVGNFHIETLEKIGKVCKGGDTSRGSTYVERGLLYGCSLFRAESGSYVVTYKYLCKA